MLLLVQFVAWFGRVTTLWPQVEKFLELQSQKTLDLELSEAPAALMLAGMSSTALILFQLQRKRLPSGLSPMNLSNGAVIQTNGFMSQLVNKSLSTNQHISRTNILTKKSLSIRKRPIRGSRTSRILATSYLLPCSEEVRTSTVRLR